MVSKEKLPVLKNINSCFVINIAFIFIQSLTAISAKGNRNVYQQYCNFGNEDHLDNWRNVTCATGETTPRNLESGNSYRILNDNSSTTPMPSFGYYCMAFKTSMTETHDGVTAETFNVEYNCDTEGVCDGKNMHEGYQTKIKNAEGTLYCCDSGNNCNDHSLLQSKLHPHTCYNAYLDGKDNIKGLITMETCSSKDVWCLKETSQQVINEDIIVINETYRCDTRKICDHKATVRSVCKKNTVDKIETTTCCCKDDHCYVPNWTNMAESANNPSDMGGNSWQRIIIIGMGVALGILVTAVAIFLVRRNYVQNQKRDSPKHYGGMVYKTVNGNHGGDGDNVKILPGT